MQSEEYLSSTEYDEYSVYAVYTTYNGHPYYTYIVAKEYQYRVRAVHSF